MSTGLGAADTSGEARSAASSSTPRPAATVILLRPGSTGAEVLLTHRPTTMAFAAGMHVFPGGAVDAADADPRLVERSARTPAQAAGAMGDNVTPEQAMALHLAAIRELFEEAGVLLADGRVGAERLAEARRRLLGGDGLADAIDGVDLRLRTDLLVPLAHWTTPRFMPRRFSTWFFAADLPAGAEATLEGDEVIALRWVSPQLALDQMADGQIEMWIPTSSTLQRLVETEARTATELLQRVTVGPTPPARIVAEEAAQVRFAFGAVGGLPGRTGETMLIGRRDLVLADPGDPSDEAIDLIAATVARRNGAIKAIVLTSADPDRAAAAQALAIALEVPVLVAPGAGRYLPYETRDVADGERLPGDVAVHVRLGPGSGRLEIVADT